MPSVVFWGPPVTRPCIYISRVSYNPIIPQKRLQEKRAIPCVLLSLKCIIALFSRSLFLGLESLLGNSGIYYLESCRCSLKRTEGTDDSGQRQKCSGRAARLQGIWLVPPSEARSPGVRVRPPHAARIRKTKIPGSRNLGGSPLVWAGVRPLEPESRLGSNPPELPDSSGV